MVNSGEMAKHTRYPIRVTISFTQEEADYLDNLVLKKEFESIAHAIRNFVEAGISTRKAGEAYAKLGNPSHHHLVGDNCKEKKA